MDFYVRSDLACESNCEDFGKLEGADWSVDEKSGFRVSRLEIRSSEAARRLEREKGCYLTVECGRMNHLGEDDARLLECLLAEELRGMAERLCGKALDSDFGVFVAGLGNVEMTADAVGPKTVRKLTATRHLKDYETGLYREIGCASLSTLAPGVLGQTGIETLELLRGAVRYVRPDVAIVVDALAARSCDRLASTVQISDAGIHPGSGVGNHRRAICAETLEVPVIAIGVPTVVNSSTLVYDALSTAGICEIDDSLRQVLENGKSFFVSPKESDVITEEVSNLLANAIGLAFTGIV
ncbi:MAG: GPR endopeptidase [Clostridia bacterium]|nr:GPR endopeptidase [Clostridia bacterium]